MKSGIKVLLLLVLPIILIVFGVKIIAPNVIQHRLIAAVEKSCASCSLSIEHTSLSFFPAGIAFEDIQFSGGNPKATAVKAEINGLSTRISLRHLFSGEFDLSNTQVEGPHVDVVEGDLSSPPSKDDDSTEPKFVIEGIQISNGTFSYTRVYGTRKAELHMKNLHGTVGQMGSIPSFRDIVSRATITGRLENSGEFQLTVATPIFAEDLSVDVALKLTEQNLADTTPFFKVDSGMELSGILHHGNSLIQIRNHSLHGWVMAQYSDLKIKLEKTKERGAIAAFFSNIVSSAKIISSDVGKKHEDQIRIVDLVKGPKDNTVIKFILHGLRDAALHVATGGKQSIKMAKKNRQIETAESSH